MEKIKTKAYALITALTWQQDDRPNYAILNRQAEVLKDRIQGIAGTEEVELYGDRWWSHRRNFTRPIFNSRCLFNYRQPKKPTVSHQGDRSLNYWRSRSVYLKFLVFSFCFYH